MVDGDVLDVGGVLERRERVRETREGDDVSSHLSVGRRHWLQVKRQIEALSSSSSSRRRSGCEES